jgi:hypothetical protein
MRAIVLGMSWPGDSTGSGSKRMRALPKLLKIFAIAVSRSKSAVEYKKNLLAFIFN